MELKKLNADELLVEMGQQRSEAETQQLLADQERLKADEMAKHTQLLEQQAEIDLAAAKPAMLAAHEAGD